VENFSSEEWVGKKRENPTWDPREKNSKKDEKDMIGDESFGKIRLSGTRKTMGKKTMVGKGSL